MWGWTLTAAAAAAGVSVRCAREWVGRYRAEGELGLHDRSSAPRRVANRTPVARVGVIVALRRLRFTAAEIAESAFREQERFERGDLVKVGVTDFVEEHDRPVEILEISPEIERAQVERVRAVRGRRDAAAAEAALSRLSELATTDADLVEPLVECARALCTQGEIVSALRGVFGSYTETPRF